MTLRSDDAASHLLLIRDGSGGTYEETDSRKCDRGLARCERGLCSSAPPANAGSMAGGGSEPAGTSGVARCDDRYRHKPPEPRLVAFGRIHRGRTSGPSDEAPLHDDQHT